MGNHKLIYSIVGSVIAIAALIFVLEATNVTNFFAKKSQSTESAQEARANADKKEAVINAPAPAAKDGSPEETGAYTPPKTADGIAVEAKQNGNEVIVTAKLTGYSDGECQLDITNGGATFTASATVIYQQEFSSCAGFSVPVDKLGAGNWAVDLKVTAGGITQNKTTSIEVK